MTIRSVRQVGGEKKVVLEYIYIYIYSLVTEKYLNACGDLSDLLH